MRNFSARSLLMLLMLFSYLHAGEEVVKKVVYDLTTGDIERFEKRLIGGIVTHKNYYHGKLESLDVRVVVHGDAYKFFMYDLNGTVYPFVTFVENAAIGLIDAQNSGYAYLPLR